MSAQIAATLAALVLASAAGSGVTTPQTAQLGTAESFSVAAGRALGAAASCNAISGGRIDRDADRLGQAIELLAKSPSERRAAHRLLVESVGEGGGAVEQGWLDCIQVQRALAEIERRLPR
jgi:hypothetical protein